VARQKPYYPFRDTARAVPDFKRTVQQAIYDVSLERVNEAIRVEKMSEKQQAFVFRILHRALESESFMTVVDELARLSDQDVDSFREAMAYHTLPSILRLGQEASRRLEFLDRLHELVYGDESSTLKERSQLHKILEPNCWIFDPRYHLASSDKSFRNVVRLHRELANLDPVPADDVLENAALRDIPDLFLAAKRQYDQQPPLPRNYHLLVELKRPSVTIGQREFDQAIRYANTLSKTKQFDKDATHWDVFLVSSNVSDTVDMLRRQNDKPVGCVLNSGNVTVWVWSWGEIIDHARREMQLVTEMLEQKADELRSVTEYLHHTYPTIVMAPAEPAST